MVSGVTGTGKRHQSQALQLTVDSFQKRFFCGTNNRSQITVSINDFFVLQALQLTVLGNGIFWGLLRKKSLEEIFFKMLLRKK